MLFSIDNDNKTMLFAYKTCLLINLLTNITYIALLYCVPIVSSEYIAVYIKCFIKNWWLSDW